MRYTLIYFSAFGETKKVNDFYMNNLENYEVFDITDYDIRNNFNFNNFYEFIILSFPIYSQNIPKVVKTFIKKLRGNYVVINTTFGAISSGNGLSQAYNIFKKNKLQIIATAIIPTNHCYLDYSHMSLPKLDLLQPVIDKINSNDFINVKIQKQKKNILANIYPDLRSRLALKIRLNKHCTNCMECISSCPVKAINSKLKLNNQCIRCLKCVNICPTKARYFIHSYFLKQYLIKYQNKNTNFIINI